MREQDLNLRPLAYEASELTRLLYPAIWCQTVNMQLGKLQRKHIMKTQTLSKQSSDQLDYMVGDWRIELQTP